MEQFLLKQNFKGAMSVFVIGLLERFRDSKLMDEDNTVIRGSKVASVRLLFDKSREVKLELEDKDREICFNPAAPISNFSSTDSSIGQYFTLSDSNVVDSRMEANEAAPEGPKQIELMTSAFSRLYFINLCVISKH